MLEKRRILIHFANTSVRMAVNLTGLTKLIKLDYFKNKSIFKFTEDRKKKA